MKPFEEIVSRLKAAGSILVVTHARPDGDGLGSMVALAGAARAAGRRSAMLVPDAVPERYGFLFGGEACAGADRFEALAGAAEAVVIVDTCALGQLDCLPQALESCRPKVAVIDHHAMADDIGGLRWIDTSAAASGVMVVEVLAAMGWPVTADARAMEFLAPGAGGRDSGLASPGEALAIAITSDTGWLRFANTDSRCLRAMERLLDAGVRPDVLYARLYQSDRPQRLRLMQRMLASLELHCGDRLAVMTLRKEDFAASGARPDETENLVNEALRIGCVESCVLLVETGQTVRASLRSRQAVDVAAMARQFGGGGHARAAGIRLGRDIDAFKAKLIEAFEREFRGVRQT
jgi:phosphoesterase RecJ-like protein